MKTDLDDPWLILCLKERGIGDVCLWWRANACGYTVDLDKAGRYTKAEALRHAPPGQSYPSTIAVRLADVVGRARKVVPLDGMGPEHMPREYVTSRDKACEDEMCGHPVGDCPLRVRMVAL